MWLWCAASNFKISYLPFLSLQHDCLPAISLFIYRENSTFVHICDPQGGTLREWRCPTSEGTVAKKNMLAMQEVVKNGVNSSSQYHCVASGDAEEITPGDKYKNYVIKCHRMSIAVLLLIKTLAAAGVSV